MNPAEATLEIRLPDPDAVEGDQDQEWCEIVMDGGEKRRIRFHDYDEIFSIPGLYERLFYDELECQSPRMVRSLLADVLSDHPLGEDDLHVLDVGAGNGIVAEELTEIGVETITGVDIIEEAAQAAERDRPGLYDDYHVVDLTDIPAPVDEALGQTPINCMTSVAALGFGDIPPEAFAGAYDYVADGGLVAISINSKFVNGDDRSGFATMIDNAITDGSLEVKGQRSFPHRLSAAGEPIHYDAIVAEKQGALPIPD